MSNATLVEVDVSIPPYQNGTYSGNIHKKCDQDTLNRYQYADQEFLQYGGTVGDGFTIIQGSFHTGYPPSAGTHDGSGVNDLVAGDTAGPKQEALAKVSCIYFYRTAADGFDEHGHTVSVGNPDLQWLARSQVTSFYAGKNGLANNGPFRLAPGVNKIPTLEKWSDPWHGEKPPPPAEIWPVWSDWPGADKTGWNVGIESPFNLQASCAVGIRGYAGAYADNVDWTWDVPAMQGLQRWQANHQPWAGQSFDPDAWSALGRIPLVKHDSADFSAFVLNQPSHESFFVQMLLVLQGFQKELNQHATRVWRPNAVLAVKAFQSHVGIAADGVVGPVTWQKLWETHK